MRFSSLSIKNFKAIRELELPDLQDFVVVAGPNGCGKSCIFDAIRLLKSAHSGRLNEFPQFLSELQIDQRSETEITRLFRDPSSPIEISADLELSDDELHTLREECASLIRRLAWSDILKREVGDEPTLIPPDYQKRYGPRVEKDVSEAVAQIEAEFRKRKFPMSITLRPGQAMEVGRAGMSNVIALLWQVYEPEKFGIIDYHGPERHYQRENINTQSIQLFRPGVQIGRTSLYHPQQKYQQIKSELTVAYLRDLMKQQYRDLVKKDSGEETPQESLTIMKSISDMFDRFFPGKSFDRPLPDREGRLQFRVTLDTGQSHDIDDLSSGEKELIYGYLRVRTRAPRNSVLLMDEPELHLNPRLLRGLAHFHREHLGLHSNNQLWIATHSDVLLREVWGGADCSAFHIRLPDAEPVSFGQAVSIAGESDLDRAIDDLAGPVTTDPLAKVVFFEGKADRSFDVEMVKTLFPEFEKQVTLVPLGEKTRVYRIQVALREVDRRMQSRRKLYSIVDKDLLEDRLPEDRVGVFHWPVYEIENFLLEPRYIRLVLQRRITDPVARRSEADIKEDLEEVAKTLVDHVIEHMLSSHVRKSRLRKIPSRSVASVSITIAEDVYQRLERETEVLDRLVRGPLKLEKLQKMEAEYRRKVQKMLLTGAWRTDFSGYRILEGLLTKYHHPFNIAQFRDEIVAEMKANGHKPPLMQGVINEILSN
jgi:predicted ATPase